MRSLSRRYLYRVIAPECEILSFAQPLESIQRKGGSIAAPPCAPRFCRANPNKTCGARRDKREQNNVTA